MGIETDSHNDESSTNTKYDPDEDGDVENVDLSEYGGEVKIDEISGNVAGGNTIDDLVGRGLETLGGRLRTESTPGSVRKITHQSLGSDALRVEVLNLGDEFDVFYQDFANAMNISLITALYDAQSNTIGDGTPKGDFSEVSTPQVKDSTGTATLGESVASGSITLSSGSATIDTGVGVGNTATFYVALGPDTNDADVAADICAQSGGNYEVDIQETDTSIGNPSINYDIVRVR